jgi:hypothetical protein
MRVAHWASTYRYLSFLLIDLGFVQAAEKFQIGHKYQLFFEFQGKLKNLTTSGSTEGFFYIQGKRRDDD